MSDPFFMRHLQDDSYRGILFPGSALSYGQVVNKEVKMGEKRVTVSEEGEGDSHPGKEPQVHSWGLTLYLFG